MRFAIAQPLIEIACPPLREVLNKAAWVFHACNSAGSHIGGENEDLASMTLYRHLIEVIDGVEVLFEASCAGAALPLLRAGLEASLSLDYIFQDDYARRSLCWSCAYVHARIGAHRKVDPTTPAGAELVTARLRLNDNYLPSTYDSGARVRGLESVLARDEFVPIEVEYQRLKSDRNGRRPEWFQLFDGPQNRRVLSKRVDREAEYLISYAEWSGFSHGGDASRYIRPADEPGRTAFLPVRAPYEMQHGASMALWFVVRAMRGMLQHFRPEEELREWYLRDMKPEWDRLRGTKIEIRETDRGLAEN